jgi:hypothetical protein
MHTLRATKQISEPFLQITPGTLQTHGLVDIFDGKKMISTYINDCSWERVMEKTQICQF